MRIGVSDCQNTALIRQIFCTEATETNWTHLAGRLKRKGVYDFQPQGATYYATQSRDSPDVLPDSALFYTLARYASEQDLPSPAALTPINVSVTDWTVVPIGGETADAFYLCNIHAATRDVGNGFLAGPDLVEGIGPNARF